MKLYHLEGDIASHLYFVEILVDNNGMSSNRKTVFADGQVYHIYNRGVEKRPVFEDVNDHKRAIETIKYYKFRKPPMRLSYFMKLSKKDKQFFGLSGDEKTDIEILAYCLMPNHFHLLIKQLDVGGVSRFVSKITNSYTKYFNTKYTRVGPLFQGVFKAVRIEDDEQLLHVSRYIHLNPVASFLVDKNALFRYQWSSLKEYVYEVENSICKTELILNQFKQKTEYRNFVLSQVDLAKELELIKHLTVERMR